MLRVECESCKAPYQVDERRVPAQGLKMRCPKCGSTFLVKSPSAATPTSAGSPPDDAPPSEKRAPAIPAKSAMKSTMVGMGAEADFPATRAPSPLGAKVPPRPAPPTPKAPAAPARPAAPPPAPPKLPPAAVASPVVDDPFADGPVPDLPTPARRDPIVGIKPLIPRDQDDVASSGVPPALLGGNDDLPAAKSPGVVKKAPAKESDLPAVAQGFPARKPPVPTAAKKPSFEIDLSGPIGGPAAGRGDLPAVAGQASFDLDLPSAAKANRPGDSFEIDLPTTKGAAPPNEWEADLPTAASSLPSLGTPKAGSFDLDLPTATAALPTPSTKTQPKPGSGAFGELDLPSLSADLPIASDTALPVIAASLPATANVLPATANVLPQTASVLPSTANALPARSNATNLSDFGELDLQSADSVPPKAAADFGFGELDLPPGATSSHPFDEPISASPVHDTAPLREAPMREPPVMREPPPPPMAEAPPLPSAEKRAGGMAFGEVDLGGPEATNATEAAIPQPPQSARELSLPQETGRVSNSPGEVALPTAGMQPAARPRPEGSGKPSRARRVVLVVFALAILGGGALELTPQGAFGRNVIADKLHAKDYTAALTQAGSSVRSRMDQDTFPQARGAADDALSAHARTPRAKPLTAYAAFVEFSYETRFGADADRNARAKQALAEIAAYPETQYYSLALAAQEAAKDNLDQARKGLDAASRRDAGDPIQEEIALLRGELELHARDATAAKAAFSQALKTKASARAHYGLARAAKLADDDDTLGKEITATLAATPNHPGALILRAQKKYIDGDETGALADYTVVNAGPAMSLAAPREAADALAQKGYIDMKRSRAGDARASFESALKLIPTHVDALVGQGMLLSSEGRTTEALSRFDTALQNDSNDIRAIAWDALTKVHLERLKEAKDQLVKARGQFPKSMLLAYALAEAERALGDRPESEKAFREAIDLASPKDPDAVLPYVALATLLVSADKGDDAKTVIADAGTKLPDTPVLERALGEFLASQGQYDDAVVRYKRATELDQADLATRYKLGVTYRRMRKMDDAAAEFDQVLAVDKDYPGLSLERGLLYEESGDTEKALEQFKNALAKAPDDPDLMLRVGAAYVAIDRPDDALPMLRKVLDKRANSAEANHYLGRALFAKGGSNSSEAIRYLKRATELDPNRAEYHLYVAWAANDSNSREALGVASDEIEKAFNLDKLNGDIYWQRGVLARKQGRVEDALRDLKRALELKPTRIDAHATIAECLEDKNDTGAAMAEWQKAVVGDNNKPAWRYRYGKLLLDRGSASEAAKHLSFAATEADKMDVHPGWYADAQFQTAEAYRRTGQRKEAIARFQRFLEVAPTSSPDRRDAISALTELGAPYAGGP